MLKRESTKKLRFVVVKKLVIAVMKEPASVVMKKPAVVMRKKCTRVVRQKGIHVDLMSCRIRTACRFIAMTRNYMFCSVKLRGNDMS